MTVDDEATFFADPRSHAKAKLSAHFLAPDVR